EDHLRRFTLAALEAWCGPHVPSADERARHATALRTARESAGAAGVDLVWVEPDRTPAERDALARIDELLAEAPARIAAFGEGWPRVELWQDEVGGTPRLALQLRPLPELHDTIELRTAGYLEAQHPERKGPNIARYAALNRDLGTEALLTDARGHVLEGATTSLVWWPREQEHPEQHGFVVASEARVPSVTESLIITAGGDRLVGEKPHRRRIGQPQPRSVTPALLADHEVWAVNALHGIRVATSIDGAPLPPPHERRLKWFREALDRAWEPVLP
ncbi:MAG: hypothetical protein J0H64_04215, partial [Actinobacteria bacterium]|nr:hypothetical protein [Actinomycetota bacterium]